MRPAVQSNAPSRPWWSRSKSSKDPLHPSRAPSGLGDEDEKYPSTTSSTSSKPKDAIPALKFNTLASAIGFKSKKLPSLTIQDPPSPLPPSHYAKSRPGSGNSGVASPAPVDRAPFYTNRPPAKSVSTVRSSEYDFDAASEPHSEPRTPSDHPRDRFSYQHSVMTFSEVDPFASGGIIMHPMPQDPNRLSVYSDSSMLDPQHKRPDIPPPMTNRVSYGSSSSNSHGNYSDSQVLSPLSTSSFARSPTASRSAHDLTQTNDQYYADGPASPPLQAHRTRRTKTPSGSNSSNSTVTQNDFRSRLSEPPSGVGMHIARKRSSPALGRPRGATVGAIDYPPSHPPAIPNLGQPTPPLQPRRKESGSSSPSSSNTPSPSPVVFSRQRTTSTTSNFPVSPSSPRPPLSRKASSSRLPASPAPAPPTSGLPPTPSHHPRLPSSPYGLSPLEFRASSSSSSLNFAPSVDLHDLDDDDPISQLLNGHYDLGPFEATVREPPKGKARKNRNTYILDGDLSPIAGDVDTSLPSPLSKFPPVPTAIHGDISPKAAKLLKKMSSQQNFSQRHSATSLNTTVSGPPDDVNSHGSGHASAHAAKTPRKQRSFHTPRGIPRPFPGLRSSSNHPSASADPLPTPSSPIVEPRRGNVASPRKRLFSGSSTRRSTSSHGPAVPADVDDKRSVFSFESDTRPSSSSGVEAITMSFGTAGGGLSFMTRNACISPSSIWEDGSQSRGSEDKRLSQTEYVPQYIMSPAEQIKLAEKLEDEEPDTSVRAVPEPEPEYSGRKPMLDLHPGDFGLTYSPLPGASRSRSNSVLSSQSTGTLAFGDKVGLNRGPSILSSKTSISSRPSPTKPSPQKAALMDLVRGGPTRAASVLTKPLNKPPPLSTRPSTSQGPLSTPPASPAGFTSATHSPEIPAASLPPPPRRRPSRYDLNEVEQTTSHRASVVPMNPLSPPPMRPMKSRRQESTDTTTTVGSRPPSSFDRQKNIARRSLMKKPSFLDIEDEFDLSAENGSDKEAESAPESPTMEDSFLDMDRGKSSFDTVRSMDSAFYV
ncbi:hypothetical protein BD309DRAFT_1076062 [Dichomitus squalens]|nr:hypothetical protein BD309DRAFT_1076062 [Dichomitus squalens]